MTTTSQGVQISITGCVEKMVRAPNPMSLFSLFLFFLRFSCFYHVFIVFRYKKVRAEYAMERTKPINQNKNTQETKYPGPPLM